MFGALCGVASSIFVALNAIYTTRCLPCVDKNVWRLCLYNNFNACILFLPLMAIFGEIPIVANYSKLLDIPFWTAMTFAGFLGFSMGYVTGFQIQMTSPLTHNVSGTAKSYVQTLLAIIIYSEVIHDCDFLNMKETNYFISISKTNLGQNFTVVDIERICTWRFGTFCTCSNDRNETKTCCGDFICEQQFESVPISIESAFSSIELPASFSKFLAFRLVFVSFRRMDHWLFLFFFCKTQFSFFLYCDHIINDFCTFFQDKKNNEISLSHSVSDYLELRSFDQTNKVGSSMKRLAREDTRSSEQ